MKESGEVFYWYVGDQRLIKLEEIIRNHLVKQFSAGFAYLEMYLGIFYCYMTEWKGPHQHFSGWGTEMIDTLQCSRRLGYEELSFPITDLASHHLTLEFFPHCGLIVRIMNRKFSFIIFLFFINLFIYFWLHQVFVAVHGLFSSCGGRGLLFVAVCRLLIVVASLVAEQRLQGPGLQQLWLTDSRAQAQQLWRTGLFAPRHVGSSPTRARTRVPCIGRRILNHCATREARKFSFRIITMQF